MNSCYKQLKSDYRKNSNKKKKAPSKIFKKKNSKAPKKPKVGPNLSGTPFAKTTNMITNCTCPADFTSFVIDTKTQCFKYGKNGPLSSAVSICAQDGARPPLPRNVKENADLLAYFLSKKEQTHHEFALDLNDATTEGLFMSSIGQKAHFTNWYMDKPDNKTVHLDFVSMFMDGKWNVHNGNHTADAIVCQVPCSTSK